jgi:hypothetical protein
LELIWLAFWGVLPIHYISTSLSISIMESIGTDMVGMMGSSPHLLYFYLLEHLNNGKYSPSIMFPSLQSICNDGKYFLSFLSSFPFKASAIIESTFNLKILHFPPPAA